MVESDSYKAQCLPGTTQQCVKSGAEFDAATPVSAVNGVFTGNVTGLDSNTLYSCYVIAFNAYGRTCSNRILVVTAPGAPQNITTADIGETSITPEADTVPGTGAAVTYKVQCLVGDVACSTSGSGFDSSVDGVVSSGRVSGDLDDLISNQEYSCYVIAISSAGTTCSAKLSDVTEIIAAKPTVADGTDPVTKVLVSGPDAARAPGTFYKVSYKVQCQPSGTPCNAANYGAAATAVIQGGIPPTELTRIGDAATALSSKPFASNTAYQCFIIASWEENGNPQTKCSIASDDHNTSVLTEKPVVADGTDATVQIEVAGPAMPNPPGTAYTVIYKAQCQPIGTECSAANYGAQMTINADGSLKKVQVSKIGDSPLEANATNIASNSRYKCFIIASWTENSVPKTQCSSSSDAHVTGIITAKPIVAVKNDTEIEVSGPAAVDDPGTVYSVTYKTQCQPSGVACDVLGIGVPVSAATNGSIPVTDVTETANGTALAYSTQYQCYILAYWTEGTDGRTQCSAPSVIGTSLYLPAPDAGNATYTTILVSAPAPTVPPGSSGATYKYACIITSQNCTGSELGTAVTPLQDGSFPEIFVTGLFEDTDYYCYIIGTVSGSSQCSPPSVQVKTLFNE